MHTNGDSHCANGTPTHHHSTKSLKDTQQRAISSELGELTGPGETKTKTQMARAFQESQELFKSADSKAGLQTVKTRRVLKKTTTITKGENEKVCYRLATSLPLSPFLLSLSLSLFYLSACSLQPSGCKSCAHTNPFSRLKKCINAQMQHWPPATN